MRWLGRCPSCGAFNTLKEFREAPDVARAGRGAVGFASGAPAAVAAPVSLREIDATRAKRLPVHPEEVARVFGGGLVEGSVVLLGGEPGVGKSTLLTGLALDWTRRGIRVVYVAGEESPAQIRLRAERLGFDPRTEDGFQILQEVQLEALVEALGRDRPGIVVADSVQTLHSEHVDAYPGSPTQIRACGGTLADFARRHGCPVFLVGHVTKAGDLAGPKLLEHMVDTVLYFEGDGGGPIRLVRATKNRFGTTGEVAVLEMRREGLVPVDDASALFLAGRDRTEPGAAVCAVRNGSRVFLVEVQALVAHSPYGTPQRVVQGVDTKRVALLAAILEKRAGMDLGGCDVFVKVAGGARLDDPAADLAILVAIASSLRERAIAPGTLILGEVGLTGEVRGASGQEERLREALRHGFTRAVCAGASAAGPPRIAGVSSIEEAVAMAFDRDS